MEKIKASSLAGKYWKPISKETGTGPEYIYNEMGTFAIPSVHESFDGYLGPRDNSHYTTGKQIPGTNIVPITHNLSYREPFHSFKYYEAMGSTYGVHEIINERETFLEGNVSITNQWKTEPINIDRIDRLRTDGARSSYTSSNDVCAFTMVSTLQQDGSYTHTYGDKIYTNKDGQRELEVFVGEFHLLPNTPRSIFRCNLAADIQYIEQGIDVFNRDLLTAPIVHNEKIRHNSNSFLEFEIGLTRLGRETSRPYSFNNNDLNIRHPNYLEAGAQIRWKSMKDRCLSWQKIYDGLNLGDKIENETHPPGHYICNTRFRINIDKLEARLNSLNKTSPLSDFRIIIYLPTYNILPIDTIISVSKPRLSLFIDSLDDIEFNVQRNYKSNGNIHYGIEISKGDKENIIFRDGTSDDHEKFKDQSIQNIKYGKWMLSINNSPFDTYGTDHAMFDNLTHSNGGINVETYGKVKYIPDESLIKYITENNDLFIRIVSYEGTKRE